MRFAILGLLAPRVRGQRDTGLFHLLGQQRATPPAATELARISEKYFHVDPMIDSFGQEMHWSRQSRFPEPGALPAKWSTCRSVSSAAPPCARYLLEVTFFLKLRAALMPDLLCGANKLRSVWSD